MADNITPPHRREPIVDKTGTPTLRMSSFMETIASAIPNEIPDIADVTGLTIAGNESKINEILLALKTAGIMA